MKQCAWYQDEFCVNDACPACADFCPLDCAEGDRWEMCKFYEPEEADNEPDS